MKIRKVTAFIVSLAMVLSSLSFLAAFAKATDSITYTAYGAEDAVVAVEDFRLDGPGGYTVFIPAETEKIVFSVTTKDNAEPDFTPYGNEIATEGLTAEAGFTVEEEVYSLLFVKQNDENKVIENIEIIAVGAGEAETALEFEFDAYRQGADVRNNVKAPSDTVALKFNITTKEGAAVLINGEAPEESYAINTKYPIFYIEGALGQLIYDYKICVAVEGVSALYELTLEYGFGEDSVIKKINLFSEGAEYTITAPRGVLTVNAEMEGLRLFHKNHSELAGLDADGAFTYENGVTLEARNGSDDVIFTITLENAPEGFPEINSYTTASYKGGEFAGRRSFPLDVNAPEIKFYNLADTFDVLVDFGYPYGYDVMVGEEVYPGGLGIPAAEGEAVISVTIGEEVYELPVTLAPEAFLPSLISLSVTPLDADGNELSAAYILEGLETGETIINGFPYRKGTAKYQIAVPQAEFCENVQIPIAPVAVESYFSVTLLNENGESEYKIIFERDDTNDFFGIGVDFKDADGVLIKDAWIDIGDEIIGDQRAATVDFYVYAKDLDHTVTVNGVEAVPHHYGYYKATLDADMQSPVAVVSVFDEQNKLECFFNYVVPALSQSAELTALTVTAVDENGAETAAAVDFENGFIILPEGAVAFRINTESENAYKELSYGGRLFEEGEVLALSEDGRLVIRLLSEDGSDTAEYSFCFNHGEYLTGIYLDGELIEGFSPEITDYHFDAPEDKESATLSVAFPEGTAAEFEPEIVFIDGTVTATITVTGSDGSKTEYYVSYEREIPLLTSETLLINRETGFVTGLTFGMKLTDLKALFDNPAENIKFYKNGEEVENGNVATGIEVALVNGNGEEVDRLTLVLYGDISGDGKINTSDILAIVIHNNSGNITGAKLKAADPSGDGKVNSTDILRIILFNNGGTINQDR